MSLVKTWLHSPLKKSVVTVLPFLTFVLQMCHMGDALEQGVRFGSWDFYNLRFGYGNKNRTVKRSNAATEEMVGTTSFTFK